MFLFSGSGLKHKAEWNDPNYNITSSFHCKANLDCIRTLKKSWELFQRGIPTFILREGEMCWRGKSHITMKRLRASAVIPEDIWTKRNILSDWIVFSFCFQPLFLFVLQWMELRFNTLAKCPHCKKM